MSAEMCELNGQPGRVILRLFDWDDASRQAVAQWKYDGVEPKSALGSFEPLADFADRVHWLYYPDVDSSAGLERLTAVRRITFGDELPQPKFDLRQLPALEVVQCEDASGLDKRHLNHPRLRYLDLEGLKVSDLTFLSEAQDLEAMRLRRCVLTGLKGSKALNGLRELRLLGAKKLEDVSEIGQARNLEILEIDEAKKLRDISAVHSLEKLRYLFIEAEQATQTDLAWIANMPLLECAGLWLETRQIDFAILAKSPRLYDILLETHAGFDLPDDAALVPVLQSHGKRVLKVTRFPKALRPSIRIEFSPPCDLADAKPLQAYQTKLLANPNVD
ncbi:MULTISPECIES: hypothetical protein [unclassified Duganella]|uniref:hypothetical protein n=1 Tax=unclassified Duganella TaxID=2636909 RepID=UPI0006F8A791|nr:MULTISPECIES: hypothetical protein [unclassified Duganella]KQV54557.1 hypothetical protein ASD07_08550 [Duganella sp. Root336D2]KRC03682.1 hypothetical protein ASE26_02275 [Duganella sp. Root198D2]